jgi:methyl-accepting chemotaxis protein
MSRTDELVELRREFGELGRDLRASMEGIRSDLTTGYVSTSGMGAVTAAWSSTIEHVEKRLMLQLEHVEQDIAELDERLDRMAAWGTWAARLVGGVILLGLLALLGLGTGNL